MKIRCNSNYDFNLNDYDVNKSVELWIDTFDRIDVSRAKKKIFIALEPEEVIHLNEHIEYFSKAFHFILTYDETLLKKLDNAILFEFGTTWIDLEEAKKIKKEFSVSTVCGQKSITKHQKYRHKVWLSQEKITIPKKFFLSQHGGPRLFEGNEILRDSKMPMFNSMFHICMENVSKKYYFTEKLIDSFICKSVPIYFGCSNVEDYFDERGIIRVNNADDVIKACNSLTEKDYNDRLEYIEENFKRAIKWKSHSERVYNKIKELI
jgi:hypothetical protein